MGVHIIVASLVHTFVIFFVVLVVEENFWTRVHHGVFEGIFFFCRTVLDLLFSDADALICVSRHILFQSHVIAGDVGVFGSLFLGAGGWVVKHGLVARSCDVVAAAGKTFVFYIDSDRIAFLAILHHRAERIVGEV